MLCLSVASRFSTEGGDKELHSHKKGFFNGVSFEYKQKARDSEKKQIKRGHLNQKKC